MFVAIFLILLVIAMYHAVQFHSYLTKAARAWTFNKDLMVMGFAHKTSTQMYKDMSFVIALFVGNNLNDLNHDELKAALLASKYHIRAQVLCALIALVVVSLDGFINV